MARCLALLGMVATHVLFARGPDGDLALPQAIAGGRAAALFAVLAGVSLWPLAYELEVALIAPNRLQTIVDLVKPLKEELDRTPFGIKLFALALCPAICEELFFRGALYAAVPPVHQIWLTTVLYALATALTGNVMLGFAAAVLGFVTALERRTTGGVLAPMITHVTWSMVMLHVLPHIL